MCLDPMETVGLCTAGTKMGDKLAGAVETCKNYDVTTMRKKKPNKGKGKGKKPSKGKGKGKNKPLKCPSVEDIEMWFMEAHAMPLCMFSELGWMDDEMNEIKEVAEADIAQVILYELSTPGCASTPWRLSASAPPGPPWATSWPAPWRPARTMTSPP